MKINRTRFGVHFDATLDANVRLCVLFIVHCVRNPYAVRILFVIFLLRSCQIHSFVGWAADASIYFFNAIFLLLAGSVLHFTGFLWFNGWEISAKRSSSVFNALKMFGHLVLNLMNYQGLYWR